MQSYDIFKQLRGLITPFRVKEQEIELKRLHFIAR